MKIQASKPRCCNSANKHQRRSGRDSNPRYRRKPVCRFSKPVPSASRPPLPTTAALPHKSTDPESVHRRHASPIVLAGSGGAEGTGLEPVSGFHRGGFQDRCLTNSAQPSQGGEISPMGRGFATGARAQFKLMLARSPGHGRGRSTGRPASEESRRPHWTASWLRGLDLHCPSGR